ncbi:phage minor head protein [Nonomuraea sp. NEAU-A123]|uniref:phage minor head protein n=1 Tax=Nonomuraea sp. NEAU-A123 TaxID=2839649 RepID=UPI001BE44601|nr:phage minor head protein [Nonomuraea sp. NEAU-A123]MBT2226268.1 hypothetical protein [Nonomuraea sp. NEAU-A123]
MDVDAVRALHADDPWLAERLKASTAFIAAEALVEDAVRELVEQWLAAVRRLVLGDDTVITAASTPDLGGFAGAEGDWSSGLERIVIPALEDLFAERFLAVARVATISAQPYREQYIADVFSRLKLFPSEQFEEIRPEIQEAISEGETPDGIRSRIEAILDFDGTVGARGEQAETRRLQARINQIETRLDAGGITQDEEADLRAERSRLYPDLYASQRRWQWKARRITRTETVGAMNGGAYWGAVAKAEILGDTLYKQWLSTEDERTRLTHREADGQAQRLTSPYLVGGFPLLFPGDPTGPGHETINCRCTSLFLDAEDLDPDQLAELEGADDDGAELDVDEGAGVDGLEVTAEGADELAVADLGTVAAVPDDLEPYTLVELLEAYPRFVTVDEAGSLRILERADQLEQLANAAEAERADELVEAMVEAPDVAAAVEQTRDAWGAIDDTWHAGHDEAVEDLAPWAATSARPPDPIGTGPGYRYDVDIDAVVEDLDVPAGWVAYEDPYTGATSYYEHAGIPKSQTRAQTLAAAKAAYADWVHMQFLAAEDATRGVLLSKAGLAAGVPERSLWSGNARTARAYASEELLRWWGDHPRLTQVEWLYQELGDEKYREPARRARENSAKILGAFQIVPEGPASSGRVRARSAPFRIIPQRSDALRAAGGNGRSYSRADLARVWFAGLAAGRAGAELVDCPYRPTADGLLCLLWVRAWASQRPDTVIASGGEMPDTEDLPTGWRGVMGPLDIRTGDNRILATPPDGVRMREGTLAIMWQRETGMGHDGSVIAGRADRAWVEDLNGVSVVMGEGPLDLGGEDGREAARLLRDGFLTGLSIDPDEVAFTWKWVAKDGAEVDVESLDEDEFWEMLDAGELEEIAVMTDWRLMGATMTPFPAFDEARIQALYDYEPAADAVTAAGPGLAVEAAPVPRAYPAEHFADPGLKRLTPLTVTDDGRVYGHIAPWNECHISFGDTCVMAPRSATSYAYFHLGEIATDAGRLPVGKLTLGGGHADPKIGYRPATQHYDDVATAIAAVRAGEDKHGIWVAGRILPNVSTEDLELFLLCPPSGDWRRIGGNLELVAACSVNVPGFPNIRASAAGGVQTSLVAAGAREMRRIAHRDLRRRNHNGDPRRRAIEARMLAVEVAREVRAMDSRGARADALAVRLGVDDASRVDLAAARIGQL